MKNNQEPTPVDSILTTKASGCLDVQKDLNMHDGKSIAQLLYEEEKRQTTTE
jgi:hypothetical protein